MSWQIKIHPTVIKKIKNWKAANILKFERLIDEMLEYGTSIKTLDIKAMKGADNMYRVRIGKNRVLFRVTPSDKRIYIIEAGSRGGIYK